MLWKYRSAVPFTFKLVSGIYVALVVDAFAGSITSVSGRRVFTLVRVGKGQGIEKPKEAERGAYQPETAQRPMALLNYKFVEIPGLFNKYLALCQLLCLVMMYISIFRIFPIHSCVLS